MGLFFIIAWPLSKLLDCLLGHEHSTFFRRAELKVLVDLHGTGEGNTEQLSMDEVMIIKVTLSLQVMSSYDEKVSLTRKCHKLQTNQGTLRKRHRTQTATTQLK